MTLVIKPTDPAIAAVRDREAAPGAPTRDQASAAAAVPASELAEIDAVYQKNVRDQKKGAGSLTPEIE